MMREGKAKIRFYNLKPIKDDFKKEVLEGFKRSPKSIPPKFFYDKRGSELFEKITELKEYYLTSSEIEILQTYTEEILSLVGDDGVIIEFGSGNSSKTGIILERSRNLRAYMPIDISDKHLLESSQKLHSDFPNLNIIPVCADYTKRIALPIPGHKGKTIVLFLGSSIGNFSPAEAISFLINSRSILNRGDAMIIGVDLKKDAKILNLAYNDSQRITAEFNLNLLKRINSELGADIDLDNFEHHAFYNQDLGRIEMHLRAKEDATYTIDDRKILFRAGEMIHTEDSYKYSPDEFIELGKRSGLRAILFWTDKANNFGLFCFEREEEIFRPS